MRAAATRASAMGVPMRNARWSGNRTRAADKDLIPPDRFGAALRRRHLVNGQGCRWVTRRSADVVPAGGGGGLERVRLGLLLAATLLMEAAGDHLVGHRLGDAELGQGLDLVRHDLVAGRLDGDEDLFDGHGAPAWSGRHRRTLMIPRRRLRPASGPLLQGGRTSPFA